MGRKNCHPTWALSDAHGAAVNRTTQAFEGDVTATSDIAEVVLGAALGRAKAKGLGKPKAKNIEESHTRTGIKEAPLKIDVDFQKKLSAYKEYKRSKGLSSGDKATYQQFLNHRAGNTGDRGHGLYKKRNVVKTPKISKSNEHHLFTKQLYERYKDVLPKKYERDHSENMITLPTPFHGNHPAYTKYVESNFNDMQKSGNVSMDGMRSLQNNLRKDIEVIKKDGNYTNMNDYYKDLGY